MKTWVKLHDMMVGQIIAPDGYEPRRCWHYLRLGKAEPPIARIYALIDPNTETICYIGKTHLSLTARLSAHLTSSRKGEPTPKGDWIRGLLCNKQRPEIFELAAVPYGLWPIAEATFIRWAAEQGIRLLNVQGAGGGA